MRMLRRRRRHFSSDCDLRRPSMRKIFRDEETIEGRRDEVEEKKAKSEKGMPWRKRRGRRAGEKKRGLPPSLGGLNPR